MGVILLTRRLEQHRTADPTTVQRQRLKAGLAKATTAITRLIGAYQEELLSLDELRTRMPELRARETSLHHQLDALEAQLADREVYLKLADNLEAFSPDCATSPVPQPLSSANGSCGCSSKTFWSAPTRSPSGTPSRSTAAPAAERATAPTPIRRAKHSRVANCVGGVVSPVLANLFLHYAFDAWMARDFPAVRFERYVDDVVVHAATYGQAERLRSAIAARMVEVGLELHPDKTKIVYCKDDNRRGQHEHTSFTFLGYTFRTRSARNKHGRMFASFLPAVSRDAVVAMGRQVRRWRIHLRVGANLADLARWMNPIVRGWMQYYGAFNRSALYPLLRRINTYLVRWARKKYRALHGFKKAKAWWRELCARYPRGFAQWAWTRDFLPTGW